MAEQDQQDNKEQGPQELDPRVQRVLNVIATHIGAFHQQQRTGELTFKVKFEEGEIPTKGYSQIVDEDVL